MRVTIIGAGIAGLTTAVALRNVGVDVTVLEQTDNLKEIGAGIQIASNGTLVLRHLGLEEALRGVAVAPLSYDYRDMETGRQLFEAPLGPEAARRYGAPLYHVHRADLVGLLAAALPAGTIRFGTRCTSVGQDDRQAWVRLDDGETIASDVLIGADGIHSFVRRSLRGDEDKQSAHILMWRSLIPAERLAHVHLEPRCNQWFGAGRTVISYWVRSRQLYSILCSVPDREVHRESWTDSGDIDDMRRSFANVEPRLQALLDEVRTCFITGMFYRDPIDRWSHGRISLLGDAAHPMVPFLAQGACQGIEDAWVLATCLSRRPDDIPGALLEYQQRRLPRTTRIQSGARSMVKLMHEQDADRLRARNGRWKGMARIDPLAETSWGFCWDYDVLKAVDEPPGNVRGLSSTLEGFTLARPESRRAFELWKHAITPEDMAQGYDGVRQAYERFLLGNFPVAPHVPRQPIEVGGVPAIRVGAGEDADPVVLHFHGGGYVVGSAASSIEYASRLADAIGGACITADYRLAPEHPYPAAFDDALDAYRGLLASGVAPSRLLISGESSGAGLALALVMALRIAGQPMPAGVIAVCPFADLTLSGASLRMFDGKDPAANRDVLTFWGASYFQRHEPTDPMISPLFGDFRGLPPLFLTAADNEVLRDDTIRIHERARAAGVPVEFHLIDDSVHVFPLMPFLPETSGTMAAIARWSAEQFATRARERARPDPHDTLSAS